MVLDDDNPWDGILSATMFALRATVHTTSQYTPAQLVFGRDSVLNVRHKANWKLIKERKQKLINKGNERENKIERRTKELEEMEARLNHLQSSLRESNSLISYNNDKYITFQKSDNHNQEESKEPFYENIRHQSIENSMEMGGVNTSRDIMYS